MAILTVRNVPDEVHRALRLRAANHGRSTEAEVREILEHAVKAEQRPRLGDLLAELGRKAGLRNEDSPSWKTRATANPLPMKIA